MINLKRSILPAAFACLLVGAAAVPAHAYIMTTTTTTSYRHVIDGPGMSLGHARAIALGIEPGRVVRSTLTRGDYGQPVYVFDIRRGDNIYGVGVNAVNGTVVENVNEGVRIEHRNFWDRLFAPMYSGD